MMFVIIKNTEMKDDNIVMVAMLQVDEDETEGLVFKATTPDGIKQIQFQLTKIEVARIEQYFKERANK